MSDQMLVATRKGLFRLNRSGSSWSIDEAWFLGDQVVNCLCDTRPSGKRTLFAALKHEHFGPKMHRSTDDGESWEEVGTPTYPEKPADYEPSTQPAEGPSYDWALKNMWCVETGGPDEDGVLWCGTLPGGLFRSDDHGKSWSINESLWYRPEREEWFGGGFDYPGIHSICVHPNDPKEIIIGISCGGAWRTTDGGDTWECRSKGMRAEYMPPERQFDENIQDPHLIAQCRENPDVLWTQHHNGVFRSVNGGEQWEEIPDVPPSVFGFAVVVHPADGNSAWFVPAIKDEKRIPVDGKVVVTRTRDGGQTFEILTEGLPQEHAYDLTFRHALDIDAAGDRLAFGTTTGALFASDNQGDSWHCISAHLPPVYAVRFVS